VILLKILIIYSSVHHGNTEKITKVMAETLNCEMLKAESVNVDKLQDYDLIGFGSGIYAGKFHKSMLKLIDTLPNIPSKKAFVYSTSGQGKDNYNSKVKSKLQEKTFTIVGDFACKGFDTFGPFKLIGGISKGRPNSEDMQAAKDFAQTLIK
jgi:flavodoxin